MSKNEEKFKKTYEKLVDIGAVKRLAKSNIMPSDNIVNTTRSTNLVDQIISYYGSAFLITGYETTINHTSGTSYRVYEMCVQRLLTSSSLLAEESDLNALSYTLSNITKFNNVIERLLSAGASAIPSNIGSFIVGQIISDVFELLDLGMTVNVADQYEVDCITNTKQYFDFVWDDTDNNWKFCHAVNTAIDNSAHKLRYSYNDNGTIKTMSSTETVDSYISNPTFPYSFTDAINAYRLEIQTSSNIKYYNLVLNGNILRRNNTYTIKPIACAHYNDLQYLNY